MSTKAKKNYSQIRRDFIEKVSGEWIEKLNGKGIVIMIWDENGGAANSLRLKASKEELPGFGAFVARSSMETLKEIVPEHCED